MGGGGLGGREPTHHSPDQFFSYVELENTKFLIVNNMWDFSLFTE